MTTIRLILGDQLSPSLSALEGIDKSNDLILMAEVWDETTYVKHHKKKIAFIFSAMRHFAQELRDSGYNVHYTQLDHPDNAGSIKGEIKRAIKTQSSKGKNLYKIIATLPGEYRLWHDMKSWQNDPGIQVELRKDTRFLCPGADFISWAKGRKSLRMEYFYREMRKAHNILMNGDGTPIGGKWNYDSDNRKPPSKGLTIPPTYHARPDQITQDVMTLVAEKFESHFGDLEPFHFAVTRTQALQALDQFIKQRLSNFGDYQDAMIQNEPWMYHSHLSFYINCGLLLPIECVRAAERAYHAGKAPLNAAEGFIRQIIGWREYVRGIYWMQMPKYAEANGLNAVRKLPSLYWGAPTHMNCLSQCVKETKENAYAHHIQRLMVLGNFALLTGLSPKEVNEWFLIVYADAYEWVEMPNVTGMILYADEGYLASKPYAAGGAYINKMSDYCKNCRYKVTKKNGPYACPFNYLYWDFMIRHEDRLKSNHRTAMMIRTLDRMSPEKITAIKTDSQTFLSKLDKGEVI